LLQQNVIERNRLFISDGAQDINLYIFVNLYQITSHYTLLYIWNSIYFGRRKLLFPFPILWLNVYSFLRNCKISNCKMFSKI